MYFETGASFNGANYFLEVLLLPEATLYIFMLFIVLIMCFTPLVGLTIFCLVGDLLNMKENEVFLLATV